MFSLHFQITPSITSKTDAQASQLSCSTMTANAFPDQRAGLAGSHFGPQKNMLNGTVKPMLQRQKSELNRNARSLVMVQFERGTRILRVVHGRDDRATSPNCTSTLSLPALTVS